MNIGKYGGGSGRELRQLEGFIPLCKRNSYSQLSTLLPRGAVDLRWPFSHFSPEARNSNLV